MMRQATCNRWGVRLRRQRRHSAAHLWQMFYGPLFGFAEGRGYLKTAG